MPAPGEILVQIVQINARRVFMWHVAIIVCLALGHLFATIVWRDFPPFTLDKVRAFFDFDEEAGPSAFFSSLALLACAGAAALVSGATTTDVRLRHFWSVVGLIAAYLALDEAVAIHEKFDAIGQWLTSGRGIFTISWWVVYPFALAPFVIFAAPGLLGLDADARNRLLIAGVVFLSGAIGCEILESVARDGFLTAYNLRHGDGVDWAAYAAALETHGDSYQRQQGALALLEETLEMTGVALALRALLVRASELGATVRLIVTPPVRPASRI